MGCKKLMAEFVGTFWLVLMGCGAAVIAGQSLGVLGVGLAFGLAIVTMGYAVGGISGGHFNPAITIGLASVGRFDKGNAVGYVIAQVLGAVLGAWVLMHIADGHLIKGSLGANGFGGHSPGGYDMNAALWAEIVMTGMLVYIICALDDSKANGFVPLAIGLTVALIHIVTIPVTGTSINPARSTGPALMMGGWALDQLWLFWVAPIVGGIAGAVLHREVSERCK